MDMLATEAAAIMLFKGGRIFGSDRLNGWVCDEGRGAGEPGVCIYTHITFCEFQTNEHVFEQSICEGYSTLFTHRLC